MAMTNEQLKKIEYTLSKNDLLSDEERLEFLREDVKKLLKEVRRANDAPIFTRFEKELSQLINKHSVENVCDVPDFILAKICVGFIAAIGPEIKKTLDWHGCDTICHPLNELSAEQDDDAVARLDLTYVDGAYWLYIDGAEGEAQINLGNDQIIIDALWGGIRPSSPATK